jgi:hypothetical protein
MINPNKTPPSSLLSFTYGLGAVGKEGLSKERKKIKEGGFGL